MKLKFVQNIVIQVKTRQIFFSERKMQSFQKTKNNFFDTIPECKTRSQKGSATKHKKIIITFL